MRLALVSSLLVLSLVSPAAAGVLTVGPSGQMFTSPQAAVDAAVDGDVVLVYPGSYFAFTIDGKALAVVAGGNVTVRPPVVIRNLSASQNVTLSGFGISTVFYDPGASGIEITNCAGLVRVQRSTALSVRQFPGVRVSNSANVCFSRCGILGAPGQYNDTIPLGPAVGLVVENSTVALYATDVFGGNGISGRYAGLGSLQLPTFDAADALLAGPGAQIFASGGELRGGSGGTGASGSCSPVQFPGGVGSDGATALVLDPTAHVDLHDVLVTAGGAGAGGPGVGACSMPAGAPGLAGTTFGGAVANVNVIAGQHRGISSLAFVREQQSITLNFIGTPGDFVSLVWAPQPQQFFYAPLHGVVTYGGSARRSPMGMIPGSGTLSVALPIAELGPGVQAQKRYLQAVFRDASNDSTLSDPLMLLLLDSAF